MSARDGIACHGDLLDPDEEVCKRRHISYFGESPISLSQRHYLPEWYSRGLGSNPQEYLGQFVFDRPMNGETAIGAYLSYHRLLDLQLFDYLSERDAPGERGSTRDPEAGRERGPPMPPKAAHVPFVLAPVRKSLLHAVNLTDRPLVA